MHSLTNRFKFRSLEASEARWTAMKAYIEAILTNLPQGARAIASSDWHYNYSDPRCPHDSWIRRIDVSSARNSKKMVLSTLGAYHDLNLHFEYEGIVDFAIEGQLISPDRELDWVYDEIHLGDSSLVEHVIEFERAFLRIQCQDIKFSSTPVLRK